MATFAERIKELRTSKGYTHKQLAEDSVKRILAWVYRLK